jgi:ankyrin repeat protein
MEKAVFHAAKVLLNSELHRDNSLFAAIYDGKIEEVDNLIKEGANVNSKLDENGKYYVLENTVNRQSVAYFGDTPLMTALNFIPERMAGYREMRSNYYGDIRPQVFYDIAEKLIDNGAEVNKLDNDGYSALYHAVYHNKPKLVKKLFEKSANPTLGKSSILHLAYVKSKEFEDDSTFLLLKDYCVEWDKKYNMDTVGDFYFKLTKLQDISHIKSHLGEILNGKNSDQYLRRALEGAFAAGISWGKVDKLDFFINKGFLDSTTVMEGGYNPITYTIGKGGRLEVMDLLLKNGHSITACDSRGNRPIDMALIKDDVETMEFILDKVPSYYKHGKDSLLINIANKRIEKGFIPDRFMLRLISEKMLEVYGKKMDKDTHAKINNILKVLNPEDFFIDFEKINKRLEKDEKIIYREPVSYKGFTVHDIIIDVLTEGKLASKLEEARKNIESCKDKAKLEHYSKNIDTLLTLSDISRAKSKLKQYDRVL